MLRSAFLNNLPGWQVYNGLGSAASEDVGQSIGGEAIISGSSLSSGNPNGLGGRGLGPAGDTGLTPAGCEARQTLGETLGSCPVTLHW